MIFSLLLQRVGQCKGRVQLDKVRAVEFVDITAFNLAHTMQASSIVLLRFVLSRINVLVMGESDWLIAGNVVCML